MQTSGSASRTCNSSGAWTGTSMACSLMPPVIPSGQRIYVLEVRWMLGVGCGQLSCAPSLVSEAGVS